jgi:ABC-type multidrug transport system fused ATPase/permease subunit
MSLFYFTKTKTLQWPSQGAIEIKDLHVRYAADLEPVLKGLNVSIKPKEKVGIVGRTGTAYIIIIYITS